MITQLSKTQKLEFEYLISSLSSSARGSSPPKPYSDINWKHISGLADICGLLAMFAASALKLSNDDLPDNVRQYFKKVCNQSIFIDTNLCFEAEKILQAFEKHHIKNCPVKGYFLKQEYPQSDFRTVSDFDILFDRKDESVLKTVFAELGYEFDHSDDNQYHFKKSPYMYIEMHATLVHEFESYYKYLYNQLDRTVKRDGYEYSYQMTPEEHYLYLLIHSSNHLRIAGLGVRMVLDTYIFYKNHSAEFDMDFLNKKLNQYGLTKFELRLREIAFNWFSSDTPKLTFDEFETFILLSARLGRIDVAVMRGSEKSISESEKLGKKKSRVGYLLSRVFPTKSEMQIHYPYLKKAPFLLPVSWGTMLFKRAFIEKNLSAKRVVKNHFSYSDADVQFYKKILSDVGFDTSFGK